MRPVSNPGVHNRVGRSEREVCQKRNGLADVGQQLLRSLVCLAHKSEQFCLRGCHILSDVNSNEIISRVAPVGTVQSVSASPVVPYLHNIENPVCRSVWPPSAVEATTDTDLKTNVVVLPTPVLHVAGLAVLQLYIGVRTEWVESSTPNQIRPPMGAGKYPRDWVTKWKNVPCSKHISTTAEGLART